MLWGSHGSGNIVIIDKIFFKKLKSSSLPLLKRQGHSKNYDKHFCGEDMAWKPQPWEGPKPWAKDQKPPQQVRNCTSGTGSSKTQAWGLHGEPGQPLSAQEPVGTQSRRPKMPPKTRLWAQSAWDMVSRRGRKSKQSMNPPPTCNWPRNERSKSNEEIRC